MIAGQTSFVEFDPPMRSKGGRGPVCEAVSPALGRAAEWRTRRLSRIVDRPGLQARSSVLVLMVESHLNHRLNECVPFASADDGPTRTDN
jgi:hypothetical protein